MSAAASSLVDRAARWQPAEWKRVRSAEETWQQVVDELNTVGTDACVRSTARVPALDEARLLESRARESSWECLESLHVDSSRDAKSSTPLGD